MAIVVVIACVMLDIHEFNVVVVTALSITHAIMCSLHFLIGILSFVVVAFAFL